MAGGGLTSSGFARLAEAGAALERHESTATTLTKFPTSLRSVPKKRPPLEPPGPDTCSAWELHQWENQCFRFSPYQFRKHNMVLDRRSGCWNPPSSRTPELLMVFQANATCLSGGGAGKKQDADMRQRTSDNLCLTMPCMWAWLPFCPRLLSHFPSWPSQNPPHADMQRSAWSKLTWHDRATEELRSVWRMAQRGVGPSSGGRNCRPPRGDGWT